MKILNNNIYDYQITRLNKKKSLLFFLRFNFIFYYFGFFNNYNSKNIRIYYILAFTLKIHLKTKIYDATRTENKTLDCLTYLHAKSTFVRNV